MNAKILFPSIIVAVSLFSLPSLSHAQTALSVDLLWEADTYVPSFYQGHTLASSESTVRIIAIPHVGDTLIPKDTLFFTWSKDGVQELPQSGQGKDVYTVTAAKKYGKVDIGVSISSGRNGQRVERNIIIPTVEPRVVLYPFDSTRGIKGELAYGAQTTVEGGTMSMKAEPYYFSRVQGGDVLFRWVGGGKILTPTDADKSSMTFGVAEGVGGNVGIRVIASHFNNLLQEAVRALQITFHQEPLRF